MGVSIRAYAWARGIWGRVNPAGGLHRDPQLDAVVRRVHQVLFCPEIPFRRLNGRVPEEQLNLLSSPPAARHIFAQLRLKS